MSEDYITPRELTPLQVGLAQLNERFTSLDAEVRSIKTNHLPHIQAAIEKLEGVVAEMKESFLPLVRNLNEAFKGQAAVIEKMKAVQESQKWLLWKFGFYFSAIFSIVAFLLKLYGGKIFPIL